MSSIISKSLRGVGQKICLNLKPENKGRSKIVQNLVTLSMDPNKLEKN